MEVTPVSANPMRVLLVEDNPADADLVREALQWDTQNSFDLRHVQTLAEAVTSLGRNGIEVVLLDLGLPDARGEETLEAVLAAAPQVPVVILTGLADERGGTAAVRRGAQEYLSKNSLSDELLVRTIRHSVERHRLRLRSEELSRSLIASERLKSIGQLAAGVAHEISNPAAFVAANSESIVDVAPLFRQLLGELGRRAADWPPEARNDLSELMLTSKIEQRIDELESVLHENRIGLERIKAIVQTLRSFSRGDSGEVSMVDLESVVRDACTMVRPELRPRARLEMSLEPTPAIAGNAGRLAQVLVNLLLNAGQAIQDGAPSRNQVTVRTFTDGDHVVVEVEDTGSGIPAAIQDKLFDPFFTTKPNEVGTGLGLSLSAEIVRHHGGELTFRTREGEGTCFVVRLPRETGLTPSLPPPSRRSTTERARVLVIDDERLILRAFERVLRQRHDVQTIEGGRRAIDLLATGATYDVILCDLLMPQVDGRALYQWILVHRPELATRVAFVSGGAVSEDLTAFLSTVDAPMVEKPVGPAELGDLVAELARKARS